MFILILNYAAMKNGTYKGVTQQAMPMKYHSLYHKNQLTIFTCVVCQTGKNNKHVLFWNNDGPVLCGVTAKRAQCIVADIADNFYRRGEWVAIRLVRILPGSPEIESGPVNVAKLKNNAVAA